VEEYIAIATMKEWNGIMFATCNVDEQKVHA